MNGIECQLLNRYLADEEYHETHCVICHGYHETLDDDGMCFGCSQEFYETHCGSCKDKCEPVEGLCPDCYSEELIELEEE